MSKRISQQELESYLRVRTLFAVMAHTKFEADTRRIEIVTE